MAWKDLKHSDTADIANCVKIFKATAPEHFWMDAGKEQTMLRKEYKERRLTTAPLKRLYYLHIYYNGAQEEIAISYYKTLKTPGGKSTITNNVTPGWGYWGVTVGFYSSLDVKTYVYPKVKARVKSFYDAMDNEPGTGRKERLVIVEDASRTIPVPPLPVDNLLTEMKGDSDIKHVSMHGNVKAHAAYAEHMKNNLGQTDPKLNVTRIWWKTDP